MTGHDATIRAADPEPDDSSDRGSVAVMAVGVYGGLALLVALSFMNWFVVERRAIEDSLAETRAYWASVGHATYVLSRTMQEGNCAGADCTGNDPPYAQTAQKYLNEIDGGKGGINLETWRYPDVSGSYQFPVNSVVCADPLAPPGKLGELLVVHLRRRRRQVPARASRIRPSARTTALPGVKTVAEGCRRAARGPAQSADDPTRRGALLPGRERR